MKTQFGKYILALWLFGGNSISIYSQSTFAKSIQYRNFTLSIDKRVVDLISRMTIEEKAGQLNQLNSGPLTGPGGNEDKKNGFYQKIKDGTVGSLLNLTGAEETLKFQKVAVEESRLGIPLLFAYDVIHGYKTIFPIPLAEACSWDLTAIEQNASVAAFEASAAGIHWTFAPMCDISNDPRWGRVMEGAGEDPYLGGLIAAARVKGFQGDLSDGEHLMACVKHFAGYGAVEAGREYNHVDISRFALWNKYLPPYKAAVDAGAATVMNAFNVFEGVPVSANSFLVTDILKKKWGFKGFLVSDWDSFTEMIAHGYAADKKDVAAKAFNAGSMMEMNSQTIITYLPELVKEGVISMKLVDNAVARILYYKFKLGLFDNPYRYHNVEREKAREAACKSIVLLKNENEVLPLKQNSKIALIGYYAKSKEDMFDFWVAKGNCNQAISIYEGLSSKYPELKYSDGYFSDASTNDSLINKALEISKNADVILINIGLSGKMAGEDRSLSNIKISQGQQQLLQVLRKTGKPIVALISSGRPMVLTQIVDKVDAIVQCWILGTETGNAVTEVLTGAYNPSAKTVMSFPYDEGQIPVYYNHFNTGRPLLMDGKVAWLSRYRDIPNEPLYPFGYGLSYTRFSYSDLRIDKAEFSKSDDVNVSFHIKNNGKSDGVETVQLYIQDPVASLIRPVKELKEYQKIKLKKGEEQELKFTLNSNDFSFYDLDGKSLIETGDFKLFVGGNSRDVLTADLKLK